MPCESYEVSKLIRRLKWPFYILALLVVPFFCLVLRQTSVTQNQGAIGILDPDWVYLSSSLLLAEGRSPVYTDHPGSPLMLMGAFTIEWNYKNLGEKDKLTLAESVIKRPYLYFEFMSKFFFYFAISLTIGAGIVFLLAGAPLVSVLLMQIAFFSFPEVNSNFNRLRPDLILASTAMLLMSFFTLSICWGPNRLKWIIGAILGFGISAKFSFALFATILLFYRNWKLKAQITITAAITFFIITKFGKLDFKNWFDFILLILTTDGSYSAKPELFDLDRMTKTLILIFQYSRDFLPIVYLTASIAIVSFLKNRANLNLLFPLIVVALNFLAIVRHPGGQGEVALRYFIPTFATLPTVLPMILSFEKLRNKGNLVLQFGLLAIYTFGLAFTFSQWPNSNFFRIQNMDFSSLKKPATFYFASTDLFDSSLNCNFIYHFHPITLPYALHYLNDWTRGTYLPVILKIHPEIDRHYILKPNTPTNLSKLNKKYSEIVNDVKNGTCYFIYTLKDHPNHIDPCYSPHSFLQSKEVTETYEAQLRSGYLNRVDAERLVLYKVTGGTPNPPRGCF